jgi:hypothetical protein
MITGGIGIPDQIIDDVGDSLDRPVMAPERVRKEKMPKCFRDEHRTLDEWIVAREVEIVPEQLPVESRSSGTDPEQDKQETAQPLPLAIPSHHLDSSPE